LGGEREREGTDIFGPLSQLSHLYFFLSQFS
jgi:hypothetical protein